jgi:hypothetical protein
MSWFRNFFVGLDQWVNTWFGGDPDETISSRAGKAKEKGRNWAIGLCGALDLVDEDHCETSINREDGKDQLFED